MTAYTLDPTGTSVPLPEIDDKNRLEIPPEPRLETQVRHLQDKVHAQGLAIDQLAEALTDLAKECHQLASSLGKLREHDTAAAVTSALLRSVK